MPYVSITGLRIKHPLMAPLFAWHAFRSMQQALRTPTCQLATARRIEGVSHTLTIWDNRQAMLAFLTSGAHREAMRAFTRIGTGYGFGYEADGVPSWDEVHRRWLEKGST